MKIWIYSTISFVAGALISNLYWLGTIVDPVFFVPAAALSVFTAAGIIAATVTVLG